LVFFEIKVGTFEKQLIFNMFLLFPDVKVDGKVQTAQSVKCTLDAFMELVTASHGNAIVVKAGVEYFAIEVCFCLF